MSAHRSPGFFGDFYHFLLHSSWPRLLGILLGAYVLGNVLFALGYLAGGDVIENARPGAFLDAFFFSVQTMATIGYGKMVPRTLYANVLVSAEAFVGIIGVAMVTGLIFAKFSRPTARVLFSRVAVVAPRDRVPSLMFRMANERGNNIVEAQVHVVLARDETSAEGETIRRFHDLELSRRRSALFTLTWTVVHPITERSPLHGVSAESLASSDAEIVVSMVGFDDTFSQTVHARHAYGPGAIHWNHRLADIVTRRPDGRLAIAYTRFHDVVPL